MELERVEEMKKFIIEKMDSLLEKRIFRIVENYQDENEVSRKIPEILRELANSREGFLVISYLRSSIVTENHDFYFGFYTDTLFVEENPDYVILSFSSLFEEIEEDMKEIHLFLKRKFIRIFSSEMEEIRRYYMLQVYLGCEKLFRKILENDSSENKEGIGVFFGEYMGEEAIQIGLV